MCDDLSMTNGGEWLFRPRLPLLAIDRFVADPLSLELSDNKELLTESLSSAGISHFGILNWFFLFSDPILNN